MKRLRKRVLVLAGVALAAVVLPAPSAWAGTSGFPGTYADPDDAPAGMLDIERTSGELVSDTIRFTLDTYEPFTDEDAALGWALEIDRDTKPDYVVVVVWDDAAGELAGLVLTGDGETLVGEGTVTRAAPDQLTVSFSRSLINSATDLWFAAETLTTGADGAFETADVAYSGDPVFRLAGADRIATGLAIASATWPDKGAPGAAEAVVLARADAYADALAGAPLAAAKAGPLLLTGSASLDPRVEAAITRVLGTGKTVYLLGGESALSAGIAAKFSSLGYAVVRYGGTDRFATSVQIAEQGLGDPNSVFLTTGTNFPDALGAGAAAAKVGAAVLLTNGPSLPSSVQAYLDAHPEATRHAIGGPAAAAAPEAQPLVGTDRYETARLVAETFFPEPVVIGIASGVSFADALAGGADIAQTADGGPLLLTSGGALSGPTRAYLVSHAATIEAGAVYGGAAAVAPAVRTAAEAAIN